MTKYEEKLQDAMIASGELFVKKFWPVKESKPQTESMTHKLFKLKNSSYFPGGAEFEIGRKRWRRPCFSNGYKFIFIGDSQLRSFHHGHSEYDEISINSYGGCDLRFSF